MRRVLAVLGVLAALAASPASADWGASVADLSATGQNATVPQVAIDPSGNAVAAWQRSDGLNTIVQSARYTASTSSWGSVSDLSAAGQNATVPQVAVDSSGNAVAVWVRSNGSNTIVQTARYTASTSSWGSVTDLSAAGQSASTPQVAVGSSGDAVAVWVRSNGSRYIIQAARYSASTSSWGSVSDLSAAGLDALEPQVAVDASGNAVAVWKRDTGSVYRINAARYTASSGSWGVVSTLSADGQHASGAQVAVDSSGNAVAVWNHSNGSNNIVQSAWYTASTASWGSVSDLSATGQNAQYAQVAVDSSGNAVAVWRRSNGSFDIVQAAAYAAGSWGSVTDLSATGRNSDRPQMAVDASGNAFAVWQRSDGLNTIVQSARYTASTASWGSVSDLSAAGQNATVPQVAVDSSGNAAAVWQRSNGSHTIVQALRYTAPASAPAYIAAPAPRAGYCSAKGVFMDLELHQPDTDPVYKGVTVAWFVQGKGITCDPPPRGYVLDGKAPWTMGVPHGLYPYYRAA